MSIVSSLIERSRARAADRRDAKLTELLAARDGRTGFTYAGVGVTHLTAMTYDAVWACARLLVDTISTLPVDTFRDTGGVPRKLTNPAVVAKPSPLLSRQEFVAQVVQSILEAGNAYGVIIGRDGLGFATQIELRDHADVVVTREGKTGPPIYRIDGRRVLREDVFHVRSTVMRPGAVKGLSVIEHARQEIARGLAMQRYGGQWFGDGAHPSAVLKSDGTVSEQTAKAIKQRFLDAVRGREPVVLGQGLDYSPIQVEPEKSQLVEAERLVVEKTARFFGIPPEMIGAAMSGSSVTYANREQRQQDYLQRMLAWFVNIETAWTGLLPAAQYVKFNPEGFLRADTLTRYRSYDVAIRGGWRSVNEVRGIEDLEPIDEGDRYLWPPYATSTQTLSEGGKE